MDVNELKCDDQGESGLEASGEQEYEPESDEEDQSESESGEEDKSDEEDKSESGSGEEDKSEPESDEEDQSESESGEEDKSDEEDKSESESGEEDKSDEEDKSESGSGEEDKSDCRMIKKMKKKTPNKPVEQKQESKDGRMIKKMKTQTSNKPVKQKASSDKSKQYRQKNKGPGFVLVIINHEFAIDKKLPEGEDSRNIKQLFSKHGYTVRCCSNLNKEEIIQKVKRYSRKTTSGNFICFLSSHGDQTSLSCPDGNDIEIDDILMAANTKRLRDCPKIFFIDACRVKPVSSNSSKPKKCPQPVGKDYYIGFSCLDSESSFAGSNTCGLYFKELIEVFKDGFTRKPEEVRKVRNIYHFMDKVHNNMDTKYKEIPMTSCSLRGPVFLHEKAIP